MASTAIRWIKIADYIHDLSFAENGIAEVEAGGKRMCVAWYEDQLFAFTFKCPHAGGRFIHGYIDASGNVVCPLHRYRFCLKNGRNVSGEGYYLKHWPVEVREDGLFVGLAEKGWLL